MIRLLMALLLAAIPATVRADDNRPLSVIVIEVSGGEYDVDWKLPANLDAALVPQVDPPGDCAVSAARTWADQLGTWAGAHWSCGSTLAGKSIALSYPRGAPALATIVQVKNLTGPADALLGQPGERKIPIPATPAAEHTFPKFLKLGIEHILTGFDHLLFIAGLVFVAGTARRIAITVTGFTVAHSITLALAALGLVSFPPGAVEAVIALSIVFLAVEIAKGPRDTLTWRRPVFVAASFGLLHGFGFAAVLGQIGLPEKGLVTALLAFNLGIEIGQVIFASTIVAILRMVAHLPSVGHPERVQRLAAYTVGILASYWMFERIA